MLLLGAVALALRHHLLQRGAGARTAAVRAARTVATLAHRHIAARTGKSLTPTHCRRLTQHNRDQQQNLPAAHAPIIPNQFTESSAQRVQCRYTSFAMKVGIVGCGNISPVYLRVAQGFPEIEVVAVADALPELAQERAAQFGVPKRWRWTRCYSIPTSRSC